MTRYGSNSATLLIGGYNLTSTTTVMTVDHEGVFEDTTTFGVTEATSGYVGLNRATFSLQGFYDDSTNSSNTALVAISGTDQVSCLLPAGNTNGNYFQGYKGLLDAKYHRTAGIGKFVRANAEYLVDGSVEDLLASNAIIYPLGTANSATNTGTYIDGGAGSSAGASGYLQCTALALGTMTNLVVKVQHSTDHSTWGDLITFTSLTAAPAAYRGTAAGTVNRYIRALATWTDPGGGSGQSATIFCGVVRN